MDIAVNGNLKMGKGVYIFNLPPLKTCTPSSWCLGKDLGKPRCYALRNNFTFPSVIKSSEERYMLSHSKDFSHEMIEFIQKKNIKYFRIHSSGDFYSKDYIDKWIKIAKKCEKTKFRSTTRRRDLIDKIEELNNLSNVIIRESLDDEVSEPKTNLNFAALSHLKIVQERPVYKCKDNCEICEHYCWGNRVNVCFDEH